MEAGLLYAPFRNAFRPKHFLFKQSPIASHFHSPRASQGSARNASTKSSSSSYWKFEGNYAPKNISGSARSYYQHTNEQAASSPWGFSATAGSQFDVNPIQDDHSNHPYHYYHNHFRSHYQQRFLNNNAQFSFNWKQNFPHLASIHQQQYAAPPPSPPNNHYPHQKQSSSSSSSDSDSASTSASTDYSNYPAWSFMHPSWKSRHQTWSFHNERFKQRKLNQEQREAYDQCCKELFLLIKSLYKNGVKNHMRRKVKGMFMHRIPAYLDFDSSADYHEQVCFRDEDPPGCDTYQHQNHARHSPYEHMNANKNYQSAAHENHNHHHDKYNSSNYYQQQQYQHHYQHRHHHHHHHHNRGASGANGHYEESFWHWHRRFNKYQNRHRHCKHHHHFKPLLSFLFKSKTSGSFNPYNVPYRYAFHLIMYMRRVALHRFHLHKRRHRTMHTSPLSNILQRKGSFFLRLLLIHRHQHHRHHHLCHKRFHHQFFYNYNRQQQKRFRRGRFSRGNLRVKLGLRNSQGKVANRKGEATGNEFRRRDDCKCKQDCKCGKCSSKEIPYMPPPPPPRRLAYSETWRQASMNNNKNDNGSKDGFSKSNITSTNRQQRPSGHFLKKKSNSNCGPAILGTGYIPVQSPLSPPPHVLKSGASSARLFSTRVSVPCPGQVLIDSMKYLKSSGSIKLLNVVSRLSLSFFPFIMKKMYESNVSQFIMKLGWMSLIFPIVLCIATILACVERTPISGRIRTLLISDEEEKKIMSSVLRSTPGQYLAATPSDWLYILRNLVGENYAPPDTLLGSKILDAEHDWRVRWCQLTLTALENHLSLLSPPPSSSFASTSTDLPGCKDKDIDAPPLIHALTPRTLDVNGYDQSALDSTRYSVIVVDRPEKNAFSFGFAPQPSTDGVRKVSPGVIVIFSGFLDSILKDDTTSLSSLSLQNEISTRTTSTSTTTTTLPEYGPTPQPGQPTRDHTEKLATLLSHELSHLILSHTLESYASSQLLWKQVERVGTDVVRTIAYPVTSMLGPFVNDAISQVLKESEDEVHGSILSAFHGSCTNRSLELEADRVGLRLLANAGIDPRVALKFWEDRIKDDSINDTTTYPSSQHPTTPNKFYRQVNAHNSDEENVLSSLLRSHPVNQERVESIREELSKWEMYHRQNLSRATV